MYNFLKCTATVIILINRIRKEKPQRHLAAASTNAIT